jgi:hypothetical protein
VLDEENAEGAAREDLVPPHRRRSGGRRRAGCLLPSSISTASASGGSGVGVGRHSIGGRGVAEWGGNGPPARQETNTSGLGLDFFFKIFFCSADDEFHGDIFTRSLFCQVDSGL